MRTSYAVGVDVGGTRVAAGLVERKGRIVKEVRTLTPRDAGPFAIVDAIIELIEDVSSGVHPSEIAGIGVGLPAQIDFLKQSVEFCTNLPLNGVDMRSLIMSRVRHSVTIDNDSNCAGIGESRFGAGKKARDFVMITLGTGVGGSLFFNGEPYRGSRGLAAEIGHMVVDLDGPPCPCGGTGHLESFVGRPALAARGREAARAFRAHTLREAAGGDAEQITAEHVIEAALAGDEDARTILLEAGEVLGRALVGVVNLLNPRLVIVGGGVGESCGFLVERAAEMIDAEALAGRRDVRVVQAELGNDAGMLGAAALAFDEHDSREGIQR
ncbi:ROK family protein [Anaerosoma tenue]|uniref:ROK family protein n=1 Tax=Anaerosoma tenue TaxID=2933588 RepID=UPI00226081DD|nr:ROK family protein [Anaerosoma tenue]MCK8114935.1 ROK family protein [Anaerosoma tenue]